MKCGILVFSLSVLCLPIFMANAQELGTQIPVVSELHYNYLLYLPKGYEESDQQWPMIFFLHGAGERGDNLDLVKVHGPPKIVNSERTYGRTLGQTLGNFDFIVVSPQCPSGEWWLNEYLIEVLQEVLDAYRVDQDRIYMTGLSMGGFGTWSFASVYPELIAAIAPISGGGDANNWPSIRSYASLQIPAAQLENLISMPIWVFHGESDTVVRITEDEKTVDQLSALGGNAEFTRYPGVGHDAWTTTYNNPELYLWMLRQTKNLSQIPSWQSLH